MRPGRKPKPTGLRELDGNAGHRAYNTNEPRPEVKVPTKPKWLTGPAEKEWRYMCKRLKALGVIAEIDRAAMIAYCINFEIVVKAYGKVKLLGQVVAGPKGEPITNPYLTNMQKGMSQLLRFGVEFGLTPSSRTRIHARPPEETPDLTDEEHDAAEVHGNLFG